MQETTFLVQFVLKMRFLVFDFGVHETETLREPASHPPRPFKCEHALPRESAACLSRHDQ
eukprot:1433734-Rhodomonas_salina.1